MKKIEEEGRERDREETSIDNEKDYGTQEIWKCETLIKMC